MTKRAEAMAEKFFDVEPTFGWNPELWDYERHLGERRRLSPAVSEAIDRAHALELGTKVFYIAGALTGVPEEIKARYVDLSRAIETHSTPRVPLFGYAPHLHGTDPVAHPDVSPQEVHDIDFLWSTVMAVGHFNFVTPGALGNGMEEGWADICGVPAVYMQEHGQGVSRLPRGADNVIGTIEYGDFQTDALPQVHEFLGALQLRWSAGV